MKQKVLHSSPNQNPFSLQKNSRDSVAYAEKKTLPRVSVGVFGSFHVAMTDTRVRQVTLPGCGIWTTFPFGYDLVSLRFTVKSPNVWLRLPLSLRIDWLVSNSCSHETLLHIGPPGPLWSICYYHQDLHLRQLQPGSHPEPSALSERPAYSFSCQDLKGQL